MEKADMEKRLGAGWKHLAGLDWRKLSHAGGWFILAADVSPQKAWVVLHSAVNNGDPRLPTPGYEIILAELPGEAALVLENRAGQYSLKEVVRMTEPLGREIRQKLVIDTSWQPSLGPIAERPQLVKLAEAIFELARGPIASRYPNREERPADPGRSIDRWELSWKLNLAESTVQRQMTALSEAMPGVFYRRYRATSIEIRWPDLIAHMKGQAVSRAARQVWCTSQGRSVGPNTTIAVSANDWVQAGDLHTYTVTINIRMVESQESAAVICDWFETELQKFNKLTVQPEPPVEKEKTA